MLRAHQGELGGVAPTPVHLPHLHHNRRDEERSSGVCCRFTRGALQDASACARRHGDCTDLETQSGLCLPAPVL